MHSHSHCHEKGYPVWWLRRDERGARSVVEYVRHDWSEEGVEGERREPPCLPSRVQLTGCLLHCAAQGRRRGPPACGPGRPDRAGTITSARPDDPPATPSAAARRRCGRSTFASRLTIRHLCYWLTASPLTLTSKGRSRQASLLEKDGTPDSSRVTDSYEHLSQL